MWPGEGDRGAFEVSKARGERRFGQVAGESHTEFESVHLSQLRKNCAGEALLLGHLAASEAARQAEYLG